MRVDIDTAVRLYTDRFLVRFGIPCTLSGRYLLRKCIILTVYDSRLTGRITADLYPRVAELYDTTPQAVERNMRTAVSAAWTRGNSVMHSYFGSRPRNGQLIRFAADSVRALLPELNCPHHKATPQQQRCTGR